ncbi:hypothetical protein [Arenimonas alkanexedens]
MATQAPRPAQLIVLLSAALTACGAAPDPGGEAPMGGDPAFAAPYGGPMEAGSPASGAPQPAARSDSPWQRLPVVDRSGFDKPMAALWVEVPTGWQSGGGVVWNAQAPCGATPGFQWRAQSPDGRRTLEMLPSEAWTWDNLGMDLPGGNCPRWPITDVRAYLQSWAQRNRPGARMLDYRARNDLIVSPPPPGDAQNRFWKEGGELLIAYDGPAGEVREAIAVVVMFNETTMAGVMPGEVRRFLTGIAGSPVSARAPAGQLDLGLLTHFAQSARPDPQWQALMDRHNAKIADQGRRGIEERGVIIANTGREIADINQRGWEGRNATGDDIQRRTVDGINNVERYLDPVTGEQVELDNRYDHGWRAADGSYFESNNPNLNPSVDLGIEAEEMERIE